MAMTIISDVSWDQDAWEQLAYFALRPELYFDSVADVRGENISMVGKTVKFTIQDELEAVTSALNESTDITLVAVGDSNVTVTLVEYGSGVQTSALIRGTSFVPVDPIIANLVGYNAGISLDTIARDVLAAGTNVRYGTGGATDPTDRDEVEPSDIITAVDVRFILAKLRGGNVAPNNAGLYTAFIHPDVSLDLRAETGSAAWRDPHTYSQPGEIWLGDIGAFEGARYIETPRAPLFADAGSSTTLTDVYQTIFAGRQALAKAYSTADGNGMMPRIVPSPVTDSLRRFTGMGWYWLGGYSVFRQASVYRVESSSSIGENA